MKNIYLALVKVATIRKAGMLLSFVLFSGSVIAQNITGSTSVYEGNVATYEYYDWSMGFDPNFNIIGGTKLTESFGNPYTVQVQWGLAGIGTVQFRSGETVMAELSVSITIPQPPTPNTTFSMFAQCGSTMVSRNLDPNTSIRWYWQTSPTGTRTDLGYAPSINLTVGGDLYLRARHESVTDLWSYSSLYVGNISLVTTPPNAGSITGTGTICINYPSTYVITNQLAGSGQGSISYQWEQSVGTSNNWVPISNTNQYNYSATNITTITYFRRRAFNECGSSYSNSVALVGNPTIAAAGSDQTGSSTCGLTSVTLAGNAPSIGVGSWSVVSGTGGSFGNASSPNSIFNGVAGLTYTLRWTITNSSCSSFDDVIIKFNQIATVSNAGADQTSSLTCGSTSVTLAGNVPIIGIGSWSIVSGSGGAFGNVSAANSTFSGIAGNTYTLRWTISNSPCASSTDDVVITFNRNPSSANAGLDQTGSTTCGLTSVTLAGNAPAVGTGVWSIINGTGGSFGNATSPNTSFTGVAGATYTLRWTISNSPCAASTDDVVITFNRNPTVANAGPDQTGAATCGLTSVTLAGNTPSIGTGVWSIISGTGGALEIASNPNSVFSGVAGNTYTLRWTISNGTCTASSDDVQIKFNATSLGGTVSANAEAYGTANGVLTLSNNNGTVQKWQQKLGSADWTDISNNTTSLPYTITNTTRYRAVVKNGVCANANSTEVEIIVNPLPVLIVNGLTAIAPNGSTQLTTLLPYYSYQWYKNSIAIPGANASTYTVTEPGLYKVALKARSNSPTYVTEEVDIKRTLDAPLQDMNYVRSTTFAVSGVNEATDVYQLNPQDYAIATTYFDGLGRPVQSVALGAAGNGSDLITPVEYDAFGREAKKYLPYAHAERDGRYQPTALTSQSIFYNNASDKVADDIAPYSQTIFEPSPLNRVIKQGAPGLAWQPNTDHTYNAADRTVKFSYEFNQANEVLQWTFTYPTEEYTGSALNAFGKVEAGTATAPVFYPANQLYKNKTKDEQGNQVIEYVDKEGRTVLKRVQVVTGNPSTTDTNRDTNWASTYYIYDDFGNLVCVIPPEPSKRLTTQYFQAGSTETTKNNFLKRWAFRYRYDGRQRMIMKQVPGAEPVYMIYDDRDRLVMTQDGNQRNSRFWLFTKYDQLNRPIATGIKDTSAVLTQSQMQAVVNTYYNDLATTKPWRKFGESYLGEGAPNTVHGYTNLSYPQTTTSSLNSPEHYVTVTYYDRYDFKSTWGGEYDYLNRELNATVNGVLYSQPQQASNRVIGQVTGSKVKVLDGEFNGATSTGVRGSYSWIRAINYYDDKYRLIQNIQENYKGGTDRMSSLYDFSGKILRSENIHETYDLRWGKLTKTFLLGNKLCSTADFTTQWGVSGTYSADVLPVSTNGWLQWKAFQTYGGIVIGLSDQEVDVDYASIDYGIYMVGGAVLRVYESGVIKYSQVNGFKIGDVLRIERNGSTITYLKNGVVFYTSTVPSTSQLLTDVAYLAPNILAYDIKSSFSYRKQTTSRLFDYDHTGRLINTWHKFNDQPEILLAHNDYNELGQLIDKKLHVSSPVGGVQEVAKQSVDYAYNIRGWLTHINDAALTPQAGESKDYFGMELAYNTDLGTGNPLDQLQFNGNINAMKWSNNQGLGDQKENAYNFTYDPLNRLKTADFKQKDASSWGLAKYRDANGMMQSVDAFNESIMNGSLSGYDLNGNIQFLKRTGQNGQLIDNLIYSQGVSAGDQSNKLMRVTDSASDSEGFKETNSGIDDYGYDSNGNLSYDHNKSTAELIKNGTFDSGQTEWTTTEPSRFSFVNGRVYVSAGTNTGVLTQAVAFRVGDPTFHVITINLVRTSTAGGVNVWIGNRTANSTPITVTATMQRSYAGGEQVVKLEILPEFEGYIEDISFKASIQITYNYINLPAIVYRGNEGSIRYIYTATGQKLAQVVTEGTKTKTTDYVGEYVYENDTLLFVNHEEGRISLSSGEGQGEAGGEAQAEYQYHLKDHLGNVRLTFTTKEETEATLATLETTNENEERGNFLKYDDIRKVNSRLFDHTHAPGVGSTHYAMRLSGTPQETYGLARSIAVMPGDVISAEVFAKYVDLNDPNVETFLENLAASIAAGTTSPGVVIDGGNFGTPAALTMPFGTILNKSSEAAGTPKAYLNWIVLDKNFRAILSKSGYRRITTAASENGSLDPTNGLAAEGFPHERLFTPTIEVTEPGYVYIYLSNEEAGTEVYFDDFKVTHTKSPVIQSDDYYPFGLAFNSYSRENAVDQNNLYQGKELQDELDLNLYDFHARQYDPTIGRTTTMDPMADMFYSLSSYSWAANNPMRFMDPTGMIIEDGSRKEWDKQKGRVERRTEKLQGRIDKLNAKAEAKGWSADKLASKAGNLGDRVSSLKGSLSNMNTLEGSTQVYSLKSGVQGEGGVTYDTKTGNVVIAYGNTANFVHETTHAGQFESGDMAFSADGSTLGQDVMDEVSAYKAQFAYDPSSVSGLTSSSVANSFGGITASWVQNIQASDGSKIYAPGGAANTGQVPVDINSGKAQLIKAYPKAAGALRGLPSNYTLRNTPGIRIAPYTPYRDNGCY